MLKFKTIEDITSTKEEYDRLYNMDHIFVIRSKKPDDNDLTKALSIFERDNFDWTSTLRGPYKGQPKITNELNYQDYAHGYVFEVSDDKLINFERKAFMLIMTTDFIVEKLDIVRSKKEASDEMFYSLFEEQE
jgi:hypothetical protein